MESLIGHLPKEMAVEIMSWVPADSLLRFKLISKSWHGFISDLANDPLFIAAHLRNTKSNPSTSLLFTHFCPHVDRCGPDCAGDVFSLITVSSAPSTIAEELDLPPPRREPFDRLGRWRIAGHCDGVVCLVQNPWNVVLCNPATREIRALPGPPESASFMGMGFGYDPRGKDYKLVKIFYDRFDRARVYSLGSDSWRVIDMTIEEHILEVVNRDGLYWGGVCYWLVQDFWYNKMVLCFDMSDEEFYVIKLPGLHNVKLMTDLAGLTVWNDSVALFVFSRDHGSYGFPSFIEIYVLDNDCSGGGRSRGASSWTKQLLIGPLVDIVNTFSFLHNDEFLLQATDKRLFCYNVRTQKLRDVVVADVDRLRHWNCFYVKSLVSVRKR